MKTIKRRLLSLVLAMAMVLTLAPGALAAGESVSITGDSTAAAGQSITFDATLTGFTDTSNVTYAWSASGAGVTSASGTQSSFSVTPTSAGDLTVNLTVTIPGADGGQETPVTAAKTVTVSAAQTPVTVKSVSINAATTTLTSGGIGTTVTATVTGSDDKPMTGKTVNWTVTGDAVTSNSTTGYSLTVNPAANLTAQKTAKITATVDSVKSNEVTITVNPASTTPTISLSASTTTVEVNKTLPLTVTKTNDTGLTVAFDITGSGNGTVTGNSSPYTFNATQAGTVSIKAKLMNGQKAEAESNVVNITVKPSSTTNIPVSLVPSTVSVGQISIATATIPAGLDYDSIVWTSSNTALATVTGYTGTNTNSASINAISSGSPVIKVQLKKGTTVVGEGSAVLTITGNALSITTSQLSGYPGYNATTRTFSSLGSYAQASLVGAPTNWAQNYNISWTSDNPNIVSVYNQSSITAQIGSVGKGTATIRATLTPKSGTSGLTTLTAATTIYVSYNYQLNPTVTVYRQDDYNLNDTDAKNGRSIVRQLTDSASASYYYAYVTFSDVTTTGGHLTAQTNYDYYIGNIPSGVSNYRTGLLTDIDFIPDSSSTSTKSEFRFTLTTTNGYGGTVNTYSGLMTFNITGEGSSAGDITYTADLGKDVAFDLRDFEDYYYNKTRGTLSYVTFTLPSGGTLYYDGGRLPSSNSCYASPSRTQIDLAGIYFTPTGTTATRPGSVRINFTAYGSRNYSGGTSGTVVINYLSGSAKDITYTPSGKSVSLRASDFTEAYRQAVGSTAPSGLTIQFQDVPSYGTLTYKDSSRSNSSTVTLRSSNIKNYKFTTRSSGSNQLADVTYTPSGSRNESITYIAYNGNTPQFTGKVVFNPTVVDNNMSVTFTGGQTITLDYQRFVQANASVMASTTRIRFMSLPVYGTLTYNGATVSAAGTDIVPSLLGNVVYRSSSSTTVTDKVVFTCYNAAGDVVGGGQVNLNSTGSGGSNGGVTNISQFKDVNPNAWYASDLSILLSRGIMQGKLEGKFDPLGQLKYGEALKIFLLSAGYSAQEGTGKDWAAGYKTLAVNNGWISSDVDLDAKITRNAMAELAAKVLGLSANSTVPPTWKDGTSNGYANALYYTSPQILVGNADGTFKGNDTLQRQEICKIAARVLTYKSNQQSSQLPGWLS